MNDQGVFFEEAGCRYLWPEGNNSKARKSGCLGLMKKKKFFVERCGFIKACSTAQIDVCNLLAV